MRARVPVPGHFTLLDLRLEGLTPCPALHRTVVKPVLPALNRPEFISETHPACVPRCRMK